MVGQCQLVFIKCWTYFSKHFIKNKTENNRTENNLLSLIPPFKEGITSCARLKVSYYVFT